MRAFIVIAACVGICAAGPAFAQTQRLPRVSPSEQNYTDVNRDLQQRERSLRDQQRTDFEINQLRQNLQRDQTFPRSIGSGNPNCPPSSIGC